MLARMALERFACVVMLAGLGRVQAQTSPIPELVQGAWDRAGSLPDLGDAQIEWETQRLYVPRPAALEEMRAAVRGRPDHPDRFALAMYEMRLSGYQDVYRHVLWCRGESAWRHSMDHDLVAVQRRQVDRRTYTDVTLRADEHWRLTPEELLIEPPEVQGGSPVGGLESVRTEFATELSWILDGGFGVARQARASLVKCERNGDRFVAIASIGQDPSKPVYELTLRGRLDSVNNHAFVDEAVITANAAASKSIGTRYVMSDWTQSAGGIWHARRVEHFRPGNEISERQVVKAFEVKPGQSFAEATRTPSPEGTDPVRGAVTATLLNDLRSATAVDIPSGRERTIDESLIDRASRGTPMYTLAGWISLACVVTGFGLLLYRRRSLRYAQK